MASFSPASMRPHAWLLYVSVFYINRKVDGLPMHYAVDRLLCRSFPLFPGNFALQQAWLKFFLGGMPLAALLTPFVVTTEILQDSSRFLPIFVIHKYTPSGFFP